MAAGVNQAMQGAAEAVSTAGQAVPSYSFGGYFMGLSLMFIMMAILWFGARFIKKRGGLRFLGQTPGLNIESRLSLGPRKNLLVLRYHGKRLLLGVTEHHISLLSEENLAESSSASFAESFEESFADGGQGGCKDGSASGQKNTEAYSDAKRHGVVQAGGNEAHSLKAKNTAHNEKALSGKFKDMLHDFNKRK